MTPRPRHRPALSRRIALLAVVSLGFAGLAACGDDDDEPASADDQTTETSAPPDGGDGGADSSASASAEFCEGIVGLETAFVEAPEDPAEMPAFIEDRIDPNLELIDGNAPEAIASEIEVMTSAVEEVASTGDFSAFETPEFSEAAGVVYPALGDACDLPVVEVTAVDYAFEGMPSTLEAGPTVLVMHNDATAESHELALAKLRDDVDLPLDEILALPEAESESMIEAFAGAVFAPPGATGGTVVDLSPGRWAYVCFIPVGTVDGQEGSGPPHFMEGMKGELTVT